MHADCTGVCLPCAYVDDYRLTAVQVRVYDPVSLFAMQFEKADPLPPKPETLSPKPQTQNPTLDPQPSTLALNAKSGVSVCHAQYEKADHLRRALRLLNGYKIGPGELLLKVCPALRIERRATERRQGGGEEGGGSLSLLCVRYQAPIRPCVWGGLALALALTLALGLPPAALVQAGGACCEQRILPVVGC